MSRGMERFGLRFDWGDGGFTLEPGQSVRLGRAPDNDIVLSSRLCGRRHVELRWGPAGCVVVDLGSPSGTWLNGYQVYRPGGVAPGDVLRIGDLDLQVSVEGGELLADVLRSGPLLMDGAIAAGVAIAAALVPLHASGEAHGQLDPNTVLLGAGRAALLAPPAPLVDEEGALMGNPRYAAPEQLRGVSWGPPADLHALGCLWFELLTGRFPYPDSVPAMVMAKLRDRPKAPAGCPPAVRATIVGLLAVEPAERPAAEAIVARLAGWARG